MSIVFEVDPARPDRAAEAIEAAVGALAAGKLVVVPTETVYGIAARPDLAEATGRLFEAKHRPTRLTLPVLVAGAGEAWRYGERTPAAEALARRFWPGPLTLVLRRTSSARGWDLGEERESVGLRVPGNALCRALLHRAGPAATTSANRSGQPPLQGADGLRRTFGEAVDVYLVLPPDAQPPGGMPSTVVDVTDENVRILRPGPITREDVVHVVGTARGGGKSAVQ